jgi:hypothetical protein
VPVVVGGGPDRELVPVKIEFLEAFIDSYIENGCFDAALNLKWLKLTYLQEGA